MKMLLIAAMLVSSVAIAKPKHTVKPFAPFIPSTEFMGCFEYERGDCSADVGCYTVGSRCADIARERELQKKLEKNHGVRNKD